MEPSKNRCKLSDCCKIGFARSLNMRMSSQNHNPVRSYRQLQVCFRCVYWATVQAMTIAAPKEVSVDAAVSVKYFLKMLALFQTVSNEGFSDGSV